MNENLRCNPAWNGDMIPRWSVSFQTLASDYVSDWENDNIKKIIISSIFDLNITSNPLKKIMIKLIFSLLLHKSSPLLFSRWASTLPDELGLFQMSWVMSQPTIFLRIFFFHFPDGRIFFLHFPFPDELPVVRLVVSRTHKIYHVVIMIKLIFSLLFH